MNLPAKDVESALPFYERKMRFRILERSNVPFKRQYWKEVKYRSAFPKTEVIPASGCFIEVDDIEIALKEFAANCLQKEMSGIDIHKHDDTSWKVFLW